MPHVKIHNNIKILNECKIMKVFSGQMSPHGDNFFFPFSGGDSFWPSVYTNWMSRIFDNQDHHLVAD